MGFSLKGTGEENAVCSPLAGGSSGIDTVQEIIFLLQAAYSVTVGIGIDFCVFGRGTTGHRHEQALLKGKLRHYPRLDCSCIDRAIVLVGIRVFGVKHLMPSSPLPRK